MVEQKTNTTPEIIGDDEIVFNGILSNDEIFKLQQAVKRDGVIDEDEATKLVLWAIEIRTGAECLKMLLEEFVVVNGWQNNGEPRFGLPMDELEFLGSLEFDQPLLEESKC